MSTDAYQLNLPTFEGPFDLLLHLIRENQVDIYDIPIAEITGQYLAYLQNMEALDLEIASSFIVMAATLLAIKAKMLLPPTETGEEGEEIEDAREELVHDLLEYMRFKDLAANLENLREHSRLQFARPNMEELYLNLFADENPLKGKTIEDLQNAFLKVWADLENKEEVLSIIREQITIPEQIDKIKQALQAKPKGLALATILADCKSKMEWVISFLALLEMIKNRQVMVSQAAEFADIYLYAKGN